MAKRRVKSNTLAGFWKNIKAIPLFEEGFSVNPLDSEAVAALDVIMEEVNASNIPSSMVGALVAPYFDERAKTALEFAFAAGYEVPGPEDAVRPVVRTGDEDGVFSVDPVQLLFFAKMFSDATNAGANEDGEEMDFKKRRQTRFMSQITKLPEPYLVYLAILQEVAYANEIVSVEDRDGKLHASDAGFYLSLLWAFKEFEHFYLRTQNRHLRADYGVVWHEGEWVADVKRGKGYINNE
jgi:hypothetical protein